MTVRRSRRICGKPLAGIHYTSSVASAQVKSSLLSGRALRRRAHKRHGAAGVEKPYGTDAEVLRRGAGIQEEPP